MGSFVFDEMRPLFAKLHPILMNEQIAETPNWAPSLKLAIVPPIIAH